MIYVLFLFQVVTFEDILSSSSTNNFTPFKEILRYNFGSRLFLKNVVGNLVMFVPFGIFASFAVKADNKYQALFLITFASVTIESTQLAIGRVFDVDDIILNVCGGLIGYFIYYFIDLIGDRFPKITRSKMFLNIMSLVLLGFMLYYVWMVAK